MSSLPPVPLATVASLLERLDNGNDTRQIKDEFASLALWFLDSHRTSLSAEQKIHLVNAVGTLTMKRGMSKRTTVADLRIVILDLQKAMEPSQSGTTREQRPVQKQISNLVDVGMLRDALLASVQRTPDPIDSSASRK